MFDLERMKYMVFIIPCILVALTVHEFSHALIATLFGDDLAKSRGRLSLNPLKHLDPIGFIMIILIGFGFAKPVPFDDKNFKHKKFYRVLTALAGPFSNFLMALVGIFLFKYVISIDGLLDKIGTATFENFIYYMSYYFMVINLALFYFNALPFPPLDGGHLVVTLFNLSPEKEAKLSSFGFITLMIILMVEYLFHLNLLPINEIVLKTIEFFIH